MGAQKKPHALPHMHVDVQCPPHVRTNTHTGEGQMAISLSKRFHAALSFISPNTCLGPGT